MPVSKKTSSKSRIGQRIREIRRSQKLTLEQVSKATGIPVSSLSRIENTRLSLNYEKIQKLAKVFQVEVNELLQTAVSPTPQKKRKPSLAVERAGTSAFHFEDNTKAHYLFQNVRNKSLNSMYMEIFEKDIWDTEFIKHDGEKVCYVIDGSVILYVEGHAPVIANAGDTLFIIGAIWHSITTHNCPAAHVFTANIYGEEENLAVEFQKFTPSEWDALALKKS